MNETQTAHIDANPEAHPLPMPAEHALLGLLAISESGSGHGYDLSRRFDHGEPLGDVIRLEPGMVYHHLKKLERAGWVEAISDPAAGRPARRTFALTRAGRQELERWLAEPVGRTREIRLEFLIKLYFALILDPDLAQRLVEEQRGMFQRLVDSLSDQSQRLHREGTELSRERWFGDMVLAMRLAQTQAALDWLERVGQGAAGQRRGEGAA